SSRARPLAKRSSPGSSAAGRGFGRRRARATRTLVQPRSTPSKALVTGLARCANPPPRCNLTRERTPEVATVGQPTQELGVDRALVGIAEVARIGMRDALDQPVLSLDRGGLVEP